MAESNWYHMSTVSCALHNWCLENFFEYIENDIKIIYTPLLNKMHQSDLTIAGIDSTLIVP